MIIPTGDGSAIWIPIWAVLLLRFVLFTLYISATVYWSVWLYERNQKRKP